MPLRSIASGNDFGLGSRVGLQPLNMHEQSVLSLNRAYISVYKVLSNEHGRVNLNIDHKVRIHAVLFGHDAPDVVAKHFAISRKEGERGHRLVLTEEQLCTDFVVQFMAKDSRSIDKLHQKLLGTKSVFVRWWQLYSWLGVLRVVNPYFSEIVLPSEEELDVTVKKSIARTIGEATIVTDQDSLNVESAIGSDVAAVVQGQTGPVEVQFPQNGPDSVVEEEDSSALGENEESFVPVRTSFVVNDPRVEIHRQSSRVTEKCLQSVAHFVKHGTSAEDLAWKKQETFQDHVSDGQSEVSDDSDESSQGSFLIDSDSSSTVPVRGGAQDPLKSSVRSGPVNEFQVGNTELASKTFPTTFMLG
jgi:hypothetical protein